MQADTPESSVVDFEKLYESHREYVARREEGTLQHAQIQLEAIGYKIPFLTELLAQSQLPNSILEIGCATGELIGNMPVQKGGKRVGCDISPSNIEAAKSRFPDVQFFAGDFMALDLGKFDAVILSDILEHVEDDAGFLRNAASLGRFILVNLPIEDNWLNSRRQYGPNDSSGHLRKYSIADGLKLFERAGLNIETWKQVWIHELPIETERKELRERFHGKSFSGSLPTRQVKSLVFGLAKRIPLFGRRLFASNLFACSRGFVE